MSPSSRRASRLGFASCLVALLLALPGAGPTAAARLALEPVAEIPMGNLGALAADQDRAWLGVGPRVQLLDLSAPATPIGLGFTPDLGDTVEDIAPVPGHADWALVAAGEAGAFLLDLSEPARPRELGRFPGWAWRVQAEPGRAYVLGEALRIASLAESGALTELGRIELPIEAFHVVDDIAWLATGAAGILAYSIREPARPVPIGAMDSPASAHDVQVADGFAYLADGGRRLSVVDVSDPTDPRLVGELSVDLSAESECAAPNSDCGLDARRIRVAGDRALLSLHRYLGAFNGRSPARLVSIDLGDPAAPRELAQRRLQGNPIAIALTAEHILAAEWPLWWYAGIAPCQLAEGGLGIYDTELTPLARVEAPAGANAVRLAEGKVWLADSTRTLRVFALDDPSRPEPAEAGWSGYGAPYGSPEAHDLVVEGTRGARIAIGGQTAGFVAQARAAARDRRRVRPDLPAVPDAPQNGCAPPPADQWYTRIATDGSRDYLLDMAGGLQVFEPGGRQAIGRLDGFDAGGLAARSGRVYIADRAGLQVVDASDPSRPTRLGSLALPGQTRAVAVAESADLVLLGGEDGWRRLDVRDPAQPGAVDRTALPGPVRALTLQGPTAYVATDAAVLAFDLSRPGAPVERARLEGPREPHAVAVDQNLVAVLGAGGLYLYPALADDGSDPWLPEPVDEGPRPVFLPIALRGTAVAALGLRFEPPGWTASCAGEPRWDR